MPGRATHSGNDGRESTPRGRSAAWAVPARGQRAAGGLSPCGREAPQHAGVRQPGTPAGPGGRVPARTSGPAHPQSGCVGPGPARARKEQKAEGPGVQEAASSPLLRSCLGFLLLSSLPLRGCRSPGLLCELGWKQKLCRVRRGALCRCRSEHSVLHPTPARIFLTHVFACVQTHTHPIFTLFLPPSFFPHQPSENSSAYPCQY